MNDCKYKVGDIVIINKIFDRDNSINKWKKVQKRIVLVTRVEILPSMGPVYELQDNEEKLAVMYNEDDIICKWETYNEDLIWESWGDV